MHVSKCALFPRGFSHMCSRLRRGAQPTLMLSFSFLQVGVPNLPLFVRGGTGRPILPAVVARECVLWPLHWTGSHGLHPTPSSLRSVCFAGFRQSARVIDAIKSGRDLDGPSFVSRFHCVLLRGVDEVYRLGNNRGRGKSGRGKAERLSPIVYVSVSLCLGFLVMLLASI